MSNIQPRTNTAFPALLEQYKGEVARALPRHLSADRMTRIALTAFRRTPKLGDCDPRSVFAAVIQSAQLGLEPDTLGRSYLVPYEKRKKIRGEWQIVSVECQFIPGWKGLVDLVNRSGNATVWTGAVFEGDFFEYEMGDRPFIRHKPAGEDDPKLLSHVYAVGRVKGSEWPVLEVWSLSKVRKHRDRYNKVGTAHYSFTNEEMYARKVVLLQVLKYMPASPELTMAMALNDSAEIGRQGLTIDDAAAGSWVPPVDDVTDAEPREPRAEPQAKEPQKESAPPAAREPSARRAQPAAAAEDEGEPAEQQSRAAEAEGADAPTISGLSESLQRTLLSRANSAGYDEASLLAKFGSIDLSNLNDVMAKLKAEIDAM